MIIQIPPPPTNLASGEVRRWQHHRVLIRRTWSAPWVAVDYLECVGFTECVAPSIPVAQFRFATGTIRREDQDDFAATTPKYFNDWFVRIEVIRDDGSEPELGQQPGNAPGDREPLLVWIGIIVDNSIAVGGAAYGAYADQTLTAFGLEYLLELKTVRGSYILGGASSALQEIDTTLVFNERLVRGLSEIGNRTESAIDLDADHSSHLFDGSDSAAQWTLRDAVEYLLTFFGPAEPEFTLGGQSDALAEIIIPRTDVTGRSLHEALNELINPRRGFGWRIATADDDNGITSLEISVFSVTDIEVSMGDAQIPANPDSADLVLVGRLDVAGATIGFDSRAGYGRILVTGERVLSCFSVSFADGTLLKAWSDGDQAAYQAAAGGDDARESDRIRQSRYPAVYAQFRIHPDWAYKAGDGQGGTRNPINPALKLDGSIDQASGGGAVTQGSYRAWGVSLVRDLPIRKSSPAETFTPEFLEPLVVVKQTSLYYLIDSLPGLVRMLEGELGFIARTQPAHVLAKNHWTAGGNDTDFDPANPPEGEASIDYTTMIATVALRTDQQLKVVADVPVSPLPGETAAQTQARRDQMASRVLHIHVPDAELWYVAPGTVTGVSGAGQLERHQGDSTIRNDVERLRKLAAGAVAWFGRIRSTLTVTLSEIVAAHRPGSYVRGATTETQSIAVNSIVTSRQYNLDAGTTTIQTSYTELDFGEQASTRRQVAIAQMAHSFVPRI